MPNRFNLIAGAAFALLAADAIRSHIQRRQVLATAMQIHATNEALVDAGLTLIQEQEAQERKIAYLKAKLDEHEVPIDEFDIIVMNYYNE